MGFLVSVLFLIGVGIRSVWMVPWRLWRYLFASRRDVLAEDPRLAVIMRVRNYLGLLIVVAAHVNWRWGRIDGNDLANDYAVQGGWLAVVLMISIAAVGVAFVAFARHGQRISMIARMSIPAWTIGVTLLIAWAGAFADELSDLARSAMTAWGWWDWLTTSLWLVSSLVIILLLITFIVAFLVLGVNDLFRSADAHPMMMPILVIVLSAWTLADGLLQYARGESEPLFPWWVTLALAVVGPLTVAGVSAVQLVRQREILGIDFRSVSGASDSRVAHTVDSTLRRFARAAG